MSAPFGSIEQRLMALEDKLRTPIGLDDLPLRDLRSKLIENGEPLDLSILSLPQSIGRDQLQPLAIRRVTVLPTDPRDDEIISYVADAANGVEWLLRYTSSEPTYRWRCIGAAAALSALQSADATTITSTTFVTDAGSPQITLPLAGDYDVTFSSGLADISVDGSTLYYTAATAIAGAADARSLRARTASGYGAARTIRLTGLAAAAVVAMYARVAANTGRTFDRSLRITPIRVG